MSVNGKVVMVVQVMEQEHIMVEAVEELPKSETQRGMVMVDMAQSQP